ncbi:MAG: hypothetical protein Q7J30_01505, partial [Candidatus Azambacteria bacterium]|nr:hypothetical protein [Candidatus Azambacteria bacterium]
PPAPPSLTEEDLAKILQQRATTTVTNQNSMRTEQIVKTEQMQDYILANPRIIEELKKKAQEDYERNKIFMVAPPSFNNLPGSYETIPSQ